jgi:hypothetical protein
MEELLKEILNEMKYQSKLLERLVEFEKARADCLGKPSTEQMKMITGIFKDTILGPIMERMTERMMKENGK